MLKIISYLLFLNMLNIRYEATPMRGKGLTWARLMDGWNMAAKKRSKSRAERTEEMRQSILDASLELFIEQGYDKTTTRQILQKVGILNGSLYNIYRSKDEIFADIAIRALSEAMDMMEDLIGPNVGIPERVCYLPCIEIFASSRSPRIAELLSVATERWDIQRKISAFYMERLGSLHPEDRDTMDDPSFVIGMIAYSGAIGAVLRRMSEDQGAMDEKSVMRVICSIQLKTFDVSMDDLDGYIDRLVDAFETHRIVICGIQV